MFNYLTTKVIPQSNLASTNRLDYLFYSAIIIGTILLIVAIFKFKQKE